MKGSAKKCRIGSESILPSAGFESKLLWSKAGSSYVEIRKIIPKLSPNTHLICSSDYMEQTDGLKKNKKKTHISGHIEW